MADYRLWVNEERTVLVRLWEATDARPQICEVARRETPAHTWGPPVAMTEEKV